MEKVRILDCTLRDGGYCNNWTFGYNNTKKIISGLIEAGIDIIECGFLTDRIEYNSDITKYTSLQEIKHVIPDDRMNKMFVCMINYGEYKLENIPQCDESNVNGFRIAFHKKDMLSALELCKGIQDKGYKVFIQAMVSLSYTDKEFLNLIHQVNSFEPYAFYIVDSFGVMKQRDLIRLFYMVEHNLKDNIKIGYHAHNNMQLAYSNAQTLVDIHTDREMIIDSSVFGMGRGAGNLNTELFVGYLNDNFGKSYRLQPLLTIIDQVLGRLHQQNYWGYSLPNYLSAKHNTHPDYASYLDAKKTLTVENMDEIFYLMDNDKRAGFDKKYIEDLYIRYMAKDHIQENRLLELRSCLRGRDVLVIAPGRSIAEEKEKILSYMNRDIISVSINFDYEEADTNFIFLSNLRRFRELNPQKWRKCIVTSNIPTVDVYLQTSYQNLLNDVEAVRDNAGMMLIKFLILCGSKKVYLAGLDGYSYDSVQNYADISMSFCSNRNTSEIMNSGMTKVLKSYQKQIEIEFVTEPKYIVI